jgi:ATP synthase I chain
MTPSELRGRVTLDTCGAAALLAAPTAWIGGATVGLGLLAGGVLAILNFRWLVARATAATAALSATPGTGSAAASVWLVGSGLRFGASLAACTLLLATGWAHPIALLVGFTLLPCDLIVRGLAAARVEG